jgi:hypothetical protein
MLIVPVLMLEHMAVLEGDGNVAKIESFPFAGRDEIESTFYLLRFLSLSSFKLSISFSCTSFETGIASA